MIKEFRKKYRLTQAGMAKLVGIKKSALAYLEQGEAKRNMMKSKNMRKVRRFMEKKEAEAFAHVVYANNNKLINLANKEIRQQDNVITSVLPKKQPSFIVRFWNWLVK